MYYLLLNEKQEGPFSKEQLRGFLANGSANEHTLYWQDGMAEWAPLGTLAGLATAEPPTRRVLAGFWRRSSAWFVDAIVLGVPILLIGFPLFGFFVSLGPLGPLLGFAIALPYFGVLNSVIGQGQTVGKRLLGIEVVDAQGTNLPINRSFLRYAILAIPFYLNCALPLLGLPLVSPFTTLLSCVVFFWGASILYLYLCNRRTRQSLHDLAAGSYVVRKAPPGAVAVAPIWPVHWILLSLLLLSCVTGCVIGFVSLRFLGSTTTFTNMLKVQQSIVATGEFRSASVTDGVNTTFASPGTRRIRIYSVTAWVKGTQTDLTAAEKKIAGLVLANDPAAAQSDLISISVSCGYNLGLASWSNSMDYRYSPAHWQKMLAGQPVN